MCIALADEVAKGNKVGLDVTTGEAFDPAVAGIYDNFNVKAQILHSAPVIATQLLLVDEVMRGKSVNMRSADDGEGEEGGGEIPEVGGRRTATTN